MPHTRSLLPLLVATVLPGVGCALLAQKTPTPAARIGEAELAALQPQPGARHYLIVYGSQRKTRQPAYSHTWATVVTATDAPGCPDPDVVEETISWLPADLPIRTLNRKVVPGRNYGLHETVRYMLDTKQDLARWGPYEVSPRFAHRFRVQKGFLDSGAVGYQCIDTWGEAARTGTGCDCIHAITDMDPVYSRSGYPLAFYGFPASLRVVRRVMHSPVTIGAPRTHDWLLPRLGLDQYPIERREYHGRVEPYDPANGRVGLEQVAPPLRPGAPPQPKAPVPDSKGIEPGPKADVPPVPTPVPGVP
ncbi:hypothetical protein J0H58_09485 [bacterium]|nr:hypothetical protein [bacterium]